MARQPVFTEQYDRRAARFLRFHADAVGQYATTLKRLQSNPHQPSLRLHALEGRRSALHSVPINVGYRITLELLITESEIVPINVGGYEEVY